MKNEQYARIKCRRPLRVPDATQPGFWIYLTAWNGSGDSCTWRSCGGLLTACLVSQPVSGLPGPGWGRLDEEGIGFPGRYFDGGDFVDCANAIDDFLFSLGAEEVSEEEWRNHRPEYVESQ